MSHHNSTALAIPASLVTEFDALSEAMGHGTGNYSIPLSLTGKAPVTHLGAHAWTTDGFVTLIEQAKQGVYPEGMDGPVLAALMPHMAMVSSYTSLETEEGYTLPSNTFETLLANTGLLRVSETRININTATAEELQAVNGIGPSISQAVVDGRPWQAVSDLSQIAGVSQAQADAWDSELTV